MARTVDKLLGAVLLLVGLLGFFAPHLMGAHLSPAHNVVHLATGALSLWFGLKASLPAAKGFAIAFGLVYELLGILGFALGTGAGRMLHLIPGVLELGIVDHAIHVALGGLYLVAGLATRTAPTPRLA